MADGREGGEIQVCYAVKIEFHQDMTVLNRKEHCGIGLKALFLDEIELIHLVWTEASVKYSMGLEHTREFGEVVLIERFNDSLKVRLALPIWILVNIMSGKCKSVSNALQGHSRMRKLIKCWCAVEVHRDEETGVCVECSTNSELNEE